MDKEKVEQATAIANEVLKDLMKRNDHKVYEGSGGAVYYTIAVATLAAGILTADANKAK